MCQSVDFSHILVLLPLKEGADSSCCACTPVVYSSAQWEDILPEVPKLSELMPCLPGTI